MSSNEKKFPGGLLVGETDKNGGKGIEIVAPEGKIRVGGGETVVVSDASKSDKTYEFEGKEVRPCEIISTINHDHGGVKIPCSIAEPANTTDSKMEVGDVIKNKTTMESGGKIPDRYKEMGFTHVGQQKKSTRPEKKWMVLAKKGDQYKVVHGGQKGMKDFSQHGSESRRQRFWNRMGGENSERAKDPFSPLYWHKKYGTWEDGGLIEEGGEIKEEDVTDMMWTLRNEGRQSFNAPENIHVAEVLVDRGLAVKEGNEYGLTKTGAQELMEQGGEISGDKKDTISMDVPLFIRSLEYAKEDAKTDMDLHKVAENAIDLSKKEKTLTMRDYDSLVDVDNKKIETQTCNCPTMAYHNRLSEIQREKLGPKYLAEGSQITDLKTGSTSDIVAIEHNGFRLRPQSAFNGAPRQEFTVPFDEVIDRHESNDISINGYNSASPDDHKILILVVKDIMACNIIKGKDQKIHELSERAYELGGRAEYLENKLHRRKMADGGFVYETGANSHKVNNLILFADNTRNLAEMRDAVKAVIKNRMSKGWAPTKKEVEDRFKTFLLKVQGQYIREMGNTSDAREEADLTPEEERDFLRVYAEEAWIGKASGGKLEVDPIEAKAIQYWRRLNTKQKLNFLLDNAEDVLGEPISKAPKNVQADYKKLASKQFHSLPKEVHLALIEHVIKKTYDGGGELEGYESSNGENDALIQDDIKSNVDALVVLLDCTEDPDQRAKIQQELSEYGYQN